MLNKAYVLNRQLYALDQFDEVFPVVQRRTCLLQVNVTGLSNGCSEGEGFLGAAVTPLRRPRAFP